MSLRYVETLPCSLYTGISASDTSVRITPYPLDLDGVKLVTADFGTTGYFTIDPKISGFEEICSFTGITDNGDNTATLTGVTRSLGSKYPYTTTSNGKAHSSTATIVFSDNPQVFNDLKSYIDTISIVGAANASTIIQGLVQLPTAAQINAGTATGSTGAALTITPDTLAASNYGLNLPTATQKLALAGNKGTLSSTNRYVTEQGLNLLNAESDQSQTTSNGTITTGEANATTKHSIVAEKFIPAKDSIRGVKLWKIADTGSFTGTVKISLQADTTGSPSGSDLASYTISNAVWLKLNSAAEFAVQFASEYETLTIGNSYWIVITCSTGDNSNHPNLGINTAGGYASGQIKYNNSTDGWVAVSTSILYFKTLEGTLGKIVGTDATTGLLPTATRPYSLISVDTTVANVNTTNTETQMFKKQIEGGLFGLNTGLKIKIFGMIELNGSVSTSTTSSVKIKYNGTTIASLSTPAVSASVAQIATWKFVIDSVILNNNSLSAQIGFLSMSSIGTVISGTPSAATLQGSVLDGNPVSASVDTSMPGLLEITYTNSDSTAVKTTYSASLIEKIG